MPPNPAQQHAKTMKLAAMDFALTPIEIIKQELKISYAAICNHRHLPLYRETLDQIEKQFREKLAMAASTSQLRKELLWALEIAIKKLPGIVGNPRTSNRDFISATKLVAEMAGFIKRDADQPTAHDVNEVAQELKAVKRARESVQ